jgi:predicted phage baseplate assembly protein
LRFGDGQNGAIPVANVDLPNDNIVAVTYRYGGGKQGNVAAGTIKSVGTSIPGIDENNVSNLFAAYGGRDEESLSDAIQRAPKSLRSRCRAVTQDDFTTLATQVGGVKRAFALPLVNPSYAGVDVAGAITIIVVPDADPTVPNPVPSDGLLQSVCAYLNPRRLITTELYVIGPTYQLVSVKADMIALSSSDLAKVKTDAEQSLTDFFHPLRGGIDGLGWPLGGTVYYSKVYQRVLSVAGVDRINSLTISLDGVEYPACTDVPIQAMSLLYSTGHSVKPQYSFS